MNGAPVGALVTIDPYRWNGPPLDHPTVGDCLVTAAGSVYLIVAARWTGGRKARFTCRVLSRRGAVPRWRRSFDLKWDRRDRSRTRTVPRTVR
jgi:hypothetical protein